MQQTQSKPTNSSKFHVTTPEDRLRAPAIGGQRQVNLRCALNSIYIGVLYNDELRRKTGWCPEARCTAFLMGASGPFVALLDIFQP